MLIKQTPTTIDWTDYTWNPIAGCLHGCPYCYLLRMKRRFKDILTPKFRPNYLIDPHIMKKPAKIFVGSSGDTWGFWVERGHILAVLQSCSQAPQHTFQFLTKNPKRYSEFQPIKNAWYGTTDDGTARTKYNIRDLTNSVGLNSVRFISFEPLLAPVSPDLQNINWIIIGADSNAGAEKPPIEWAYHLINLAQEKGIPVFVKNNYGYPDRIKEMPCNGIDQTI
jgi:protein gp37